MRIESLELAGFRGFTSSHFFDLNADSVVLIGANGQGKRSFFGAILWCPAGRIQRLSTDERLMSLYSETGTMHVALTLKNSSRRVTICRSFNGSKQRVTVHEGSNSYEGPRAEAHLLRQLWP